MSLKPSDGFEACPNASCVTCYLSACGATMQVIDISRPEQKEVANLMHTPVPGKHVLTITGEQPMVELVIQNNRAGLYGESPSHITRDMLVLCVFCRCGQGSLVDGCKASSKLQPPLRQSTFACTLAGCIVYCLLCKTHLWRRW